MCVCVCVCVIYMVCVFFRNWECCLWVFLCVCMHVSIRCVWCAHVGMRGLCAHVCVRMSIYVVCVFAQFCKCCLCVSVSIVGMSALCVSAQVGMYGVCGCVCLYTFVRACGYAWCVFACVCACVRK